MQTRDGYISRIVADRHVILSVVEESPVYSIGRGAGAFSSPNNPICSTRFLQKAST